MRDDDEPSWRDQQAVVIAGGVAAVVLLIVLVWAVIQTSRGSLTPTTVAPVPSSETASRYTAPATTRTSYTVPSVQTSQDNPLITGPSVETPSSEAQEPDATSDAPTTTTNPYVTTTTSNAGHI